jgi:hypothetical protein
MVSSVFEYEEGKRDLEWFSRTSPAVFAEAVERLLEDKAGA